MLVFLSYIQLNYLKASPFSYLFPQENIYTYRNKLQQPIDLRPPINPFFDPAKMSSELTSERVCYVHCNFCNTILASVQLQDFQKQQSLVGEANNNKDSGSSSKCNRFGPLLHTDHEQPKLPPIRPPEKRQRVPSAYNRFIKEEIQRIKASNPEITHREAFSTAAKNWAHFPHIHFGLKLDGNKQAKVSGEAATKKSNSF